ncbi:MAG: SHD1 domain-containing protein [Planctomycetaceae bacterium]
MRGMLTVLIISLTFPGFALGYQKSDKKSKSKGNASEYSVGQEVEVDYYNKWRPGVVVALPNSGRIQVEFEFDPLGEVNGSSKNKPDESKKTKAFFEADKVRPSKGGGTPKKTGKSAEGPRKGTAGGKSTPRGELLDWTDSTGKFKIKARFGGLADDKVTLVKDDGKTVTLALEKLDAEGQERARKLAAGGDENPFETGDENPFAGDEPEGDKSNADPADLGLVEANWKGVQTLRTDIEGDWKYSADPLPSSGTPVKKSIPLHANKNQDAFFEKPVGVALHADTLKGAMFMQDDNPRREKVAGLQMFDLAEGKAGPLTTLKMPHLPMDISPSGKRVVATANFFIRAGRQGVREDLISVHQWEGKELKPEKVWSYVPPGDNFKNDPKVAFFIDEDHLITVSPFSKMAVWNIPQAKALYTADLSGQGAPALSPGRKHLAVATTEGVCLYEALTGDSIGRLPGGNPGQIQAMAFRSDGKQLAALALQRLMVWDLEKGTLDRDIYFTKPQVASSIDWVSEGYLLVGGQNLIDLERRVVLWEYSQTGGFHGKNGAQVGDSYWYLLTANDRSARAIFPAKLPHSSAVQMAQKMKADDILAIKPGASIAIQWSVQGDQKEVNDAYQSLIQQLQDIGMTYAEKSRLVLQVSTAAGETKEIQYRGFGGFFGRGGETVRVTEYISKIQFVEDNNVIWLAEAHSGAPHMLSLKEGQTVQQALAQYQKPNVKFFTQVKLPKYVARPHPSGAYGHSELSAKGVVDRQQ